jgi:uncharacterized protein (DUF1800 family)
MSLTTSVSRRGLLTGTAAVAATVAVSGLVVEPAEAATKVPTPVVRKVVQYRAVKWRYNAKTRVTTVLKAKPVNVVARFVGSKVYLKNSKGVWVRIPYVWSTKKKGLVYSRYLQLALAPKPAPKPAAPVPTPSSPPPSPGSTVVMPAAFASVSAYQGTDWARHLLRRAGYGPTPGDLATVRAQGYSGWLEHQLNPATINDSACDAIVGRLPAQSTPIWKIKSQIDNGTLSSWDMHQNVLRDFASRAVWSQRQLLTVMEDFWGNHFNVTSYKDGTAESRGNYAYTIRTSAFGRFADLLGAVSKHPAMLTYLNNRESTAEHPNENQGRELLELHTVGIDAGYGEDGVLNSARILTGLGVDSDSGEYAYQPWNHWVGSVSVLGFSHANSSDTGGEAVVDAYLNYLAHHPATATRLAHKLAVRFVSDTPSDALVSSLAAIYLANDTAIAPVLRALFSSAEFAASIGAKVARPFEHIISVARLCGIQPAVDNLDAPLALISLADDAGHQPFGQPFPTGQPDTADAWESTATTIARWNSALSMVAGWWPSDVVRPTLLAAAVGPTLPATHGALVDLVATNLFGAPLSAAHKAAILTFLGVTDTKTVSSSSAAVTYSLSSFVAVLMDSPYQTLR